jgi:hypothetical protein
MEKIRVYPVEGRRCKDPSTMKLLPENGLSVTRSKYWIRRLKDGDCTLEKKVETSYHIYNTSHEDSEDLMED